MEGSTTGYHSKGRARVYGSRRNWKVFCLAELVVAASGADRGRVYFENTAARAEIQRHAPRIPHRTRLHGTSPACLRDAPWAPVNSNLN